METLTPKLAEAPKAAALSAPLVEKLVLDGDLSGLTGPQRVEYYHFVCDRVGVDPSTRPFEYLKLSGRVVLYARKECTEQLRLLKGISIKITDRHRDDDAYTVTAQATLPGGRTDESIGAVSIRGLAGDNLANALMKCETKAKRRATLSICGLGMLDESELETVKGAERLDMPELKPKAAAWVPSPVEDEGTIESSGTIPPMPTEEPPNPADRPDSVPASAMDREMLLSELRRLHDHPVEAIRKMVRSILVLSMRKHAVKIVSDFTDEQLERLYHHLDERISSMEGRE